MKIKKGDKVQVISGTYKNTIGEVLKAFPKENKVIVEGVNIIHKHQKPTQANPDGGIIEREAKIDVSNVALYDEKAKESGKVGIKVVVDEDGNKTKVRYFKKSGNEIKNKKR